MIKVSIVIPVYNVESYLDICVESVLDQTYQNIEIILVDDGSTDNSPAICDKYQMLDNRVKVVHQKNGGLSNARNTGVKNSTGEFLFFVDSDDCINPVTIERLVEIAVKYDAKLVQCDIEEVMNEFQEYNKPVMNEYEVLQFDTKQAFYNVDKDDMSIADDIRLITIVVWTKLYKRELFEKIQFPEHIRLHEDQMVAHQFIVEAEGIVFCKIPLYYYRKRPNSLITEGWTPKRLSIFECYQDRVEWAKKVDDGLTSYIFERYLTCMFKNYLMTTKSLTGSEKEIYCQKIIERFRGEFKKGKSQLRLKDRMIFSIFNLAPNAFVRVYICLHK